MNPLQYPVHRNKGWKTMTMVKLAATAMVLGVSMVGCSPMGQAMHVGSASDESTGAASADAKRATKALAKREPLKAVKFAEAAVAAAPRDAGYRMLLGQSYLAAGRFQSAETSFSDALKLDPERERAALNLALAQIALARNGEALRLLGEYRDKLPASDYGLAVALAGDTDDAVVALEAAARAPQADAKTRQNLALAYALAGKWSNAKVLAVQDLDPDAADARLAEWARLSQPQAAWDQVAAVLGVTAVADAGQPTRLALAPLAPSAVQVAQAEVAPAPAPVAVAAAPAPAAIPAPEPVASDYVSARPAVAFEVPAASPAVIRAAPVPFKQAVVRPTFAPKPTAAMQAAFKRPSGPVGSGFVVQLGAFQTVGVAKDSWGRLSSRYHLASFDPVNAKARVRNTTFVRLAVGGFSSRTDASDMCNRIRSSGGKCFVRAVAGDAVAQWAQRTPTRIASR